MADELSNLLRYEGAGFKASAAAASVYLNGVSVAIASVNLSDVGLSVGDVVSASAHLRNLTPGDGVRLRLRFMDTADGAGTLVSSEDSTPADTQAFQRFAIENKTIPASTVSMNLHAVRDAGVGTIEGHLAMLNRGATAAAFAQPYRGSSYYQFPLWLASSEWRIRPVDVEAMFEPFGQSPIFQEYNTGKSDFWEVLVKTPRLTARDARRLMAWAAKIGFGGKVAIPDPDHLPPGDDGVRPRLANGQVNGGSQTGNSLVTDGWDANQLILSEGDPLQIIEGQLFQATDDVLSDGSGNATIPVWPAMKTSPPDGKIVEINYPHLHSLLLGSVEVHTDENLVASPVSMPLQEDF